MSPLDSGFHDATLRIAVERRRSHPRVSAEAPDRAALIPLVAAAATVADHGALSPWRLIELRGAARERLGAALVEAAGIQGTDAARLAAKPIRAPLLIALVAIHQPSEKIPEWEQTASAAGVAHVLSLLLHDAGWGVMWRSGAQVRSAAVRRAHRLADNEQLLGWLYVGGRIDVERLPKRLPSDGGRFLSEL